MIRENNLLSTIQNLHEKAFIHRVFTLQFTISIRILYMIQIKTYLARLVAGGTITGWLGEVVHVHVLGLSAGDDLVPLDGLDVAQVVVVQDTHTPMDNI